VSPDAPPRSENEEFWRDFLSGGHSKEHAARRVLKLIPQDPRCRLCAAPFSGVGAPLMRLIGKTPSDKNPNWCASCFKFMTDHHGGAEIECTLLFADIRGSTALAEGMPPAEFRQLMDRFYDTAAGVVFDTTASSTSSSETSWWRSSSRSSAVSGMLPAASTQHAPSWKPPVMANRAVPGFRSAPVSTPVWPGSGP
jgi:hypothetical protein